MIQPRSIRYQSGGEKIYIFFSFLSLGSVRVVAVAVSPSLGSLGVVSSKDNRFLVGVPAVCWVAIGYGKKFFIEFIYKY